MINPMNPHVPPTPPTLDAVYALIALISDPKASKAQLDAIKGAMAELATQKNDHAEAVKAFKEKSEALMAAHAARQTSLDEREAAHLANVTQQRAEVEKLRTEAEAHHASGLKLKKYYETRLAKMKQAIEE